MKKETKELINWAIDHFQHYQIDIHTRKDKFNFGTAGTERESNYSQDVIAFLRKLPEIESHLCRGGYVQDKNGTPCCDGDVIINESILDKQEEKGILYWSKNDSRFYFKKADGLLNSLSINFEKVEK